MGLCPAVVVYLITGSHDAAIEHITLEDVAHVFFLTFECLLSVAC